jgi:hypothetical protein
MQVYNIDPSYTKEDLLESVGYPLRSGWPAELRPYLTTVLTKNAVAISSLKASCKGLSSFTDEVCSGNEDLTADVLHLLRGGNLRSYS